jgi:tetratricopeptide (TPR) repeat protein
VGSDWWVWYKASMGRFLATLLLGVLVTIGCTTFQGARLYTSGTEALERGDSARAIADLERAAELVPHASEIQNHLGLAYAAEGRSEDALRAFRRAVALDCDNQAAQRNLQAAEAGALLTTDR